MTRSRYVVTVTGTDDKSRYARALAYAIGPALPAGDGSVNAADLLTLGDALATTEARLQDAASQAFPHSATDTLPIWEDAYGLPSRTDLTTAERQARLAARVLAGRTRGNAKAMMRAVSLLVGTCALYETLLSDAATAGDARLVYEFALVIPAAMYSKFEAEVKQLVELAKPAHVYVGVGITRGFLTDDPNSLTDRDFLGV